MNTVKLDSGIISGSIERKDGKDIYVFRGVPYAAPPVGALRWKPPQQVESWEGVRPCTSFNIQAAQYQDPHAPVNGEKFQSSEDCLYLNILTPSVDPCARLPVMVWLHGGGLRYGNGQMSVSVKPGLPLHGAVQVNVNHRLGVMGLLAHSLLSEESPNHASGNYMFLDMIAALEWVKQNITAFGGNPNNVTIFGQSGGGLKVATLMATPLAKGLFHRAIIQSGGRDFDTVALKDMEEYGATLFRRLGIDNEKDPLDAVRKIPVETVLNIDQEINVEMGARFAFMGPWQVVHDGWFLPDTLVNMFRTGKRNQVPYLVVANKGELTGPASLIADTMIKDYLRLLKGASTENSRGYAAVFDRVPEGWRREGSVAGHGTELRYLFGGLDDTEALALSLPGYALSGATTPIPEISDADWNTSENMMRLWVHFARTGNPSIDGLVEWPAWDSNTDKYLLINDPLQVKNGYSDLVNIVPDTTRQTIF